MRIFQVEPMRFQTTEQRFNVPASAIICDCGVGMGIRDKNQIALRKAEADNMDGRPPHATGGAEETDHAEGGIAEEPGRVMGTGPAAQWNVRIMANPEPKGNPVFAEKPQPERSNKFAIRRQTVNPLGAKLPQESAHESDAFFGVGIPAFIEQRPEKGNGDPLIGHRKHEKIEIDRPELPIRSIQAERPGGFEWQETHDEPGNERRRDLERLKKPLNPTIRRVRGRSTAEGDRDLGQIDGSDADHGDEKLREKNDSGAMPVEFLGQHRHEWSKFRHNNLLRMFVGKHHSSGSDGLVHSNYS